MSCVTDLISVLLKDDILLETRLHEVDPLPVSNDLGFCDETSSSLHCGVSSSQRSLTDKTYVAPAAIATAVAAATAAAVAAAFSMHSYRQLLSLKIQNIDSRYSEKYLKVTVETGNPFIVIIHTSSSVQQDFRGISFRGVDDDENENDDDDEDDDETFPKRDRSGAMAIFRENSTP
uniref:Uncharacterized protein n=1 Tax=Vespula pensylvanica TaxID=30213 RepID=A0A834KLE0_VESPE|nr:hypothetical protein H0235_014590 [Vespula pensylvanica]